MQSKRSLISQMAPASPLTSSIYRDLRKGALVEVRIFQAPG
jgi:hypothetical protein